MKVEVEFPIMLSFDTVMEGYYFAARLSKVFNFIVFELELGFYDGKYQFEFHNNKEVRDERRTVLFTKKDENR
jgi:hypothetical protein